MNKHDLLEKETNDVLNSAENKQLATKDYLIFSIFMIMLLSIFICVKTAELQAYKKKAYNDSLTIKSLKDNLLMPGNDSLITK